MEFLRKRVRRMLSGSASRLGRRQASVSGAKQSATHADGHSAIDDKRTQVQRAQPIVRHSQSMPEPMQSDDGSS